MATSSVNPFHLLHGDDDVSVLVAKVSANKISHPCLVKEKIKNTAPAQLPSKPLPPSEYVRTGGRGAGRGTGGRGTGRGTGGRGTGRGGNGDNYHTNSPTNGDNWQVVRHGHGDGKGRGNGGNADWKNKDGRGGNGNRGYSNVKTSDVPAEKEEDKEMSLAEFEKLRLEKKKALNAVTTEERKVENEFKDMKIIGKKKEEELSVKMVVGKGKQLKKKERLAEEKARKSMALQQLLKPVEHEKSDNNGKGSDNPSSEQPNKKEIKRATQVPSTWLSAVLG